VITKKTKLSDALERLQLQGVSDLFVIDPATGRVEGVLSDVESSSLKVKWKKKVVIDLLEAQAKCHDLCESTCAACGGCKSHGVFPDGKGGWTCGIQCEDDESTLGPCSKSGPWT
jgi:hypothetical protein